MDHRMHLEREDVTETGEFVENDLTTEGVTHSMSGGHGGHHPSSTTGGVSGSSSHHMMKMYFHSSYGDVYLFKDWLLENASDTVIACVVLFFLAIVYEAVKTYQNQLLKKKYSHSNCYPVASNAAASAVGGVGGGVSDCTDSRPWLRQMFSLIHFLSIIVHVIQVAIGYALMLAVMTFNGWLVAAVVVGAGVGYFLFSWKRRSSANSDSSAIDNCYLNKSFVGDFSATGFK